MPHKWETLYNHRARHNRHAVLNSEGHLTFRLKKPKGLYRFFFEIDRGTFDGDKMFFNVCGVRVGPSIQFFRVPGMTDASNKTKHIPSGSLICPQLDVYVDGNFAGTAQTEFPSRKEFKEKIHFGEFAVRLSGREQEVRLVSGHGYQVGFLRVNLRRDEREPRQHLTIKPNLAGKHPRLYFTRASIKDLRARKTGPFAARYRCFMEAITQRRDQLRRDKTGPDSFDVLPCALAWLLTGERHWFLLSQKAAGQLLAAELPGPAEGARIWSVYMVEPGRLIETLACYYDWCYEALDEGWRGLIRSQLTRIMRWWMTYIEFNTLEWPGNPGGMEHGAYNMYALGLAGMAFAGEVPDAGIWLDWCMRYYEIARRRTPDDGCLGLYPHEHSFMAVFNLAAALHHATGVNMFANWPFFRHFPEFRLYKETHDLEMFPSYYHMDYSANMIAWEPLAALARNPQAQWLAERYREKAAMPGRAGAHHGRNNPGIAAMWRLLHYDPNIPPIVDFDRLPLDRHCRSTGLVIMRSGWLRPDAVHADLYSGTTIGQKVMELEHRVSYTDGATANSIGIYGYAEPLLGNYTTNGYRSYTANASTLTIEGDGQIPESTVFDCRRTPGQAGRIIAFHAGRHIGCAAGEAAQCYEREVGLRRFTRHLVFCKPDIILVFDEVELDRPRDAEMHFVFCMKDPTTERKDDWKKTLTIANPATAFFAGRQAGLVLRVPAALKCRLTSEECLLARGYTDQDSQYRRISLISRKNRCHRFLTVLMPTQGRSLSDGPEVAEHSNKQGLIMTVHRAGRIISAFMPWGELPMESQNIRFCGRLLVTATCAQGVSAMCGIGATQFEAAGWRPMRSPHPVRWLREKGSCE